jgi:hypothetical protein
MTSNEFQVGRDVERERLEILLKTRRELLLAGNGSRTRIDEIEKVLAMLRRE